MLIMTDWFCFLTLKKPPSKPSKPYATNTHQCWETASFAALGNNGFNEAACVREINFLTPVARRKKDAQINNIINCSFAMQWVIKQEGTCSCQPHSHAGGDSCLGIEMSFGCWQSTGSSWEHPWVRCGNPGICCSLHTSIGSSPLLADVSGSLWAARN